MTSFTSWSRKRWIRTIVIALTAIVLIAGAAVGIYFASLYRKAETAVQNMHEEIVRTQPEKRPIKVEPKKHDPISILLLGIDERSNDPGRSDTIIVLTLNPEQQSMKILSVQRDIRTEIVGKGIVDKINHAYAFGGSSMAVETVERFLDIPIDYYITVNMEVFAEIIDILGGVTVYNPIEWADEGYYQKGYVYRKGEITLDTGAKALGFVRMRHLDPRGDFGRNERQRIVLQAIIHKASSLTSITKLDDILDSLAHHVKTNMTLDDMKTIIFDYGETRKQIEELEFKARGTMINGISYQLVSDTERQRISDILKAHLGLVDRSTVDRRGSTNP